MFMLINSLFYIDDVVTHLLQFQNDIHVVDTR